MGCSGFCALLQSPLLFLGVPLSVTDLAKSLGQHQAIQHRLLNGNSTFFLYLHHLRESTVKVGGEFMFPRCFFSPLRPRCRSPPLCLNFPKFRRNNIAPCLQLRRHHTGGQQLLYFVAVNAAALAKCNMNLCWFRPERHRKSY